MAKEKLTQSEIDGVQYRRAKLWQIILVACNALNGMAIYSLIGQASYAASIGFGISTPEQAKKMAAISDGAIVGSAIEKILAQHGKESAEYIGDYVRSMKNALKELN